MHSFEVRECPLCGKMLQLKVSFKVNVYHCAHKIELPTGHIQKEARHHYEVEIDSNIDVQHMYVGDYCIDNFGNGSKSRIYHWSANTNGLFRWKFVTETPRIKPDTQEKLEERIKMLLAFL